MSPNLPEPGSPADWLRYARSDLALARIERPAEVFLEMLCFHAQQAVEKSLKAVLLWKGGPFPIYAQYRRADYAGQRGQDTVARGIGPGG
jgi:hypothetical protein